MSGKRRITLFQHWTRGYFLVLLVGVLIIAVTAVLWGRHTAKENHLGLQELLAQQLADQLLNEDGQFLDDRTIDQRLKKIRNQLKADVQTPMPTAVFDMERNQIFPLFEPQNSAPPPRETGPPPAEAGPLQNRAGEQPEKFSPPNNRFGEPPVESIPSQAGNESRQNQADESADSEADVQRRMNMNRLVRELPIVSEKTVTVQMIAGIGKTYILQQPIIYGDKQVGELLVGMAEGDAARLNLHYSLLIAIICSMLLLGWGTIYWLTRRLIRPIIEVANAANEMKDGHYEIAVSGEFKEKEVHEMMSAIQTMAEKLKHLEALRTLLLAGVTHELKTPIASISGLVQAVKDDIVQDEEKKEFLALAIQESQRLQRMVEDLLDFNSFATGALKAVPERIELCEFVEEVVHQWQMASEEHKRVKLGVVNCSCPEIVEGDPGRIQQIIVNLLNNAFHALPGDGSIEVMLYAHGSGHAAIDIIDNGKGIPAEECPYIFERFYRGQGKKYKVRGMGLGLPFSLMLARAHRGDLYLKQTSSEGTIFTLTIPVT